MSLTAKLYSAIKATLTGTGDFGTPTMTDDTDASPIVLADGTGDGQANAIFESKGRSISASSNETHDLSGGLTDPLGAAVAFTAVKAIEIRAADTNTNNVVIGAAGSNPFLGPLGGTSPTIAIPPGGRLMLIAPHTGWAVTNSSNDSLKVANSGSGSAVKYDIKIIGTK